MSSVFRISLVFTAAFFMTATSHAAVCTDPVNGPRACDYADPACPLAQYGTQFHALHSDYASHYESFDYLHALASTSDPDGYMALIDLGDSNWLETIEGAVPGLRDPLKIRHDLA